MKYRFHDHTIGLDFLLLSSVKILHCTEMVLSQGRVVASNHIARVIRNADKNLFIGETKISLVWFPPKWREQDKRWNRILNSSQVWKKACCVMSRGGKNRELAWACLYFYIIWLSGWAPIWHQDKFLQVSVDQLLTRSYFFTMWSLLTVSECESDVRSQGSPCSCVCSHFHRELLSALGTFFCCKTLQSMFSFFPLNIVSHL